VAVTKILKDRYETKEILGQGGMGVVYRAFDSVVRREVAVKTLRGSSDRSALQLFQKECDVLASLSHPNIVEIFDIGEFEEEGERRPFFVMPLLPGIPLDRLISDSAHRLTPQRVVEIMCQTCRGLHAAHERGLVHRDLKPSNIFVMDDDSVKIIDFGVAHMLDSRTTIGMKGTLLYMSPEQLEMKVLSPLSDIFSLGAVCYEALTQRRPFERSTQPQIVDAILHQTPPLASELSPAVSQPVSRVVHKAMAKQPWHRFSSAREFSEALQKALRNEPIEFLDPARTEPRIRRATKAFEQADYEFAGEILTELESEGRLDPSILQLRRQVEQAARHKKIQQLLDSARARLDENEDPLALQKVEEVLQLDPECLEAVALKAKIESGRSERQIDGWLRSAQQHMDNHTYGPARQALQDVLQLRPKERRALQMLAEVDRQEQEYIQLSQEKRQLYEAALEAWQNGEVSTALSRMGTVLELDRRAPDTTSGAGTTYRNFYNQVRSEHDAIENAYSEARRCLADRAFTQALAECDQYLAKYPGNALFQALKFDVGVQQQQEISAYIAETDRRVEGEPDLDKRVSILKEALELHPDEPHFERSLRLQTEKHKLVESIVGKARLLERQGQLAEALGQWEILRTIHSQYRGLSFEIERVTKRREQQVRSDAKARWVNQIDSCLGSSDYVRAMDLLRQANAEFAGDSELAELEKLAQQGAQRSEEALKVLAQGQEHLAQGRFDEGLKCLRQAHKLDGRNTVVRAALRDSLVEGARSVLDRDWRSAEALAEQALELDPTHAQARSLRTLVLDRKQQALVDECLSQVRRLKAAGDLDGALAQLQQGLAAYPAESRLLQVNDTLQKESLRSALEAYRRDLDGLRRLERDAEATTDAEVLKTLCQDARALAQRHPEDAEFQTLAGSVGQRLASVTQLLERPAAAKVEAAPSRPSPTLPPEPSQQGLPSQQTPPEVSVARLEQLIERLEAAPSRPITPQLPEVLPAPATGPRGRTPRWIPLLAGLALLLIISVLGVSWYVYRSHKPVPQPAPVPPHEPARLAELPLRTVTFLADLPPAVPLPNVAEVEKQPRARVTKAAPAPPKPAPGPPSEIETLYNLAREACNKGNYVEPQEQSAIAYAKRALVLDPNDAYAKQLLELGVQGGKYQVEQAIISKDFATAHRVANAMAHLLPGRNDIAERQKDIADYEAADAKAHRPTPTPAPTPPISVLVFHPHSSKLQGPYCQGTLSVIGGRVNYTPESATDGHMHPMSFACSDILEIKKNPHVLGHHDDFHLHTASGDVSFLPQHPPFDISALRSACTK
jgi:serine/threonine protein kinase